MVTRIGLLFSITWLMSLTANLFTLPAQLSGQGISGRDLILAGGGLFLLVKSVMEIDASLEGPAQGPSSIRAAGAIFWVVIQIAIVDIVFSLDSVITAVGMSNQIPVMIAAVILAMLVMLLFVNQIGAFVEKYPTIKVLALAFLILIGTLLLAEGFQQHISKGYIYFAMCFSVAVEVINIRVRTQSP
jgi:predicted tellurium resistance membrane protein TerC